MSHTCINRIVLVGNLTHDPELRALPSGVNVCNMRVACNSRRKVGDGEYEDKPGFFSVSVFGARGETIHRYLERGSRIAVDGRLDWSEWEAADGSRRETVEIVAENIQFVDRRAAEEGGEPAAGGAGIEDEVGF